MVAAKMRQSWPAGSHFQRKIALEMREGNGAWWHFLNVPEDRVEDELARWRENNPDHEFRAGRRRGIVGGLVCPLVRFSDTGFLANFTGSTLHSGIRIARENLFYLASEALIESVALPLLIRNVCNKPE